MFIFRREATEITNRCYELDLDEDYVKELNKEFDEVYDVNLYATSGMLPDLTILIDQDPRIGLKRIQNNKRNTNRLDVETINFHDNVRKGYLEVANKFSDRIKTVNGERPLDEVYQDVLKIVLEKL